ncbi:MAG: sigma 54-interacting transcriptional regulator [Deltaproteobacteria bacterium]|nr:sigma 54-interacting transcriptional regulator [Deltaproteobacteria bacterium]
MPPAASSPDLAVEALRGRLRGWLLARILGVTVFLGALALTHLSPGSDPSYPLRSLTALIVVAYAFSIASAYAVSRTTRLRAFALVQIVAEIALISAAVLLTGALESPMAVWYNLAIIGAALLLFRPGAFLAATLSSLSYGTLINLAYYGALPSSLPMTVPEPGLGILYHITANIASFFSIAFLSSILVERIAAAERALEQSEANFQRLDNLQRVLVQNLESGVLTTDAEGVVASANQAIAAIIGRPAAELLGKRISEIFPVLRPPVGAKSVRDPSPIPIELAHRARPDAEEQTLRCTSARLSDTYQNLIGALYILQDVTGLKKLTAETLPEPAAEPAPRPRASDVPEIIGFLGRSPRILQIVELIRKIAPTDSTVLITGESGTGKELAAQAIHSLGSRRDKPMVVVNCAAIPANLIESELFGHVRGAFTGAVADRRGLFRAADRGTIFLDEVGDLPLALQVKLLRVLQERAFTPVGAQSQVAVDVRIVAATNRELEAEVACGKFREDLFYRLNVICLQMPPLRQRAEDLPLLIDHFLGRFCEALHRPRCRLSPGASRRLLAHGYPGNIRELENVIEHAVALAEGEIIREEDLPPGLQNGAPSARDAPPDGPRGAGSSIAVEWMQDGSSNLDSELETIERRLLEEALRRAGGIRKRAAEILGINYRSLRHRLSKYGFGDVDGREVRH